MEYRHGLDPSALRQLSLRFIASQSIRGLSARFGPFSKATEIRRLTKHPWNVGTVWTPLLEGNGDSSPHKASVDVGTGLVTKYVPRTLASPRRVGTGSSSADITKSAHLASASPLANMEPTLPSLRIIRGHQFAVEDRRRNGTETGPLFECSTHRVQTPFTDRSAAVPREEHFTSPAVKDSLVYT